MDDNDRRQLVALRAAQERIRREMAELEDSVQALLRRLDDQAPQAPTAAPDCGANPDPVLPEKAATQSTESLDSAGEPVQPQPAAAAAISLPVPIAPSPPKIPPQVPQLIAGTTPSANWPPPPPPLPRARPEPSAALPATDEKPAFPLRPAKPEPSLPSGEPAEAPESFEMQLGTVWLVRIGIVILLTGLVFLGNYAYQNYVGRLGPAGRLALLYLAGVGLCILGAWIERGRETVRNFSRVVTGGGLATLYYTTYAAHFVPKLRVIEDPLTGGGLLLALAGGMVWVADRKRSETLATFAVLLSFYTGTINSISGFTVFSNLLLTAAAVFLLVRHRWTTMSILTLAGAYVSFGFWRYYQTGSLPWETVRDPAFASGLLILSGYWLLFTAGLFLCRDFPPARRAAFLSLNNGAYFALGSVLIWGAHPSSYWIFPALLGLLCLGLAWVAQTRFRDETLADGAYLAQGLVLLGIATVVKSSGYQLALIFGLESAVLLTCCRQRHAWIYKIAAVACAVIAFVEAFWRMGNDASLLLPLGGVLALLFLYNARWVRRLGKAPADEAVVRPLPALFSGMVLALAARMMDGGLPAELRYPCFAVAAVVFAFAFPLHGIFELALFGQFYLLGADLLWLFGVLPEGTPLPWWNPAVLVASTLAMLHWWNRRVETGDPNRVIAGASIAEGFCALGAVFLLRGWLGDAVSGDLFLWIMPALALLLLGYGAATRLYSLALAGQLLVLFGASRYFSEFFWSHPSGWFAALATVAVIVNGVVLPLAFRSTFREESPGAVSALRLYQMLPLAMFVAWGFEYVPYSWRFAFFALSGLALFALGVWRENRWNMGRGAGLLLVGLLLFWFGEAAQATWQNGAAILLLLAGFQLAKKRLPEAESAAMAAPGGFLLLATLALLVTRWVEKEGIAFYTTIAWSILGGMVLGTGLLLRDRVYRQAGLALFGLALGRIILIDIWRLETGARIVSLLVLGVVLPAFGYLYNRFAERLRD